MERRTLSRSGQGALTSRILELADLKAKSGNRSVVPQQTEGSLESETMMERPVQEMMDSEFMARHKEDRLLSENHVRDPQPAGVFALTKWRVAQRAAVRASRGAHPSLKE